MDIFLSYAHKDDGRARKLRDIFKDQNWSVFWDQQIRTGEPWNKRLEEEIKKARSVVVVWSKNSIHSRWVMEEAIRADKKETLIPVRFDGVELPMGFKTIQTADLSNWDGSDTFNALQKLIIDIGNVLSLPSFPSETTTDTTKAKLDSLFEKLLYRICSKYSNIIGCYFEAIPPKKLDNAVKSFNIPEKKSVILLCDQTVFGSAKYGFAICKDGIYWKNDWTTKTNRTKLSWDEFSQRDIQWVKYDLDLKQGDVIDLSGLGSDEKRGNLLNLLNEIKSFTQIRLENTIHPS